MNLLVIRHGRAENADDFAKTGAGDELRPLTADGQERMRRIAAGLHRIVEEIDLLASSPLVRARQTADIVAAEFGLPEIVELAELTPAAAPVDLAAWLKDAGSQETIAVVGHQPNLSSVVAWLLAGQLDDMIEIKKGAAVMLDVRKPAKRQGAGRATLLWALTPRQLRELGGLG